MGCQMGFYTERGIRMKLQQSRLPKLFEEGGSFAVEAQASLDSEDRLENRRFTGDFPWTDARGLDLRGCLFDGMRLAGGRLEKGFFMDVAFRRCDLSNLDLSGGTFRRVTFEDCKMVGALLPESSLTDVRFAGCAARYINCYEAAVHRVQFIGCDLTGAVLQSVSVRELAFSESRLTGAELFGTPLAGVDFTTSEIDGIVVAPQNLRGAVVTAPQACELARLLGVIIR